MVIEWMAKGTARRIKEVDPDKTASLAVLEYGLKIIYNTFTVIFLALICGWIFGWLKDVILVLVSFAVLRSLSGGYHIKSSDLCVIVSSGLMFLITMTSELLEIPIFVYYLMNITSLIVVIKFAPSNKTNREKESKKFFTYKIISSMMVITLLIIHNDLITLTFFIQAATIIMGKKVKS